MKSPEIYRLFRDGPTRGHPVRTACTIAGHARRVYEVDPHLPGSLSNNSAGKSAVGELMLSTAPLPRYFIHRAMGPSAMAMNPSKVSCEA
jgi:hypothetical protein